MKRAGLRLENPMSEDRTLQTDARGHADEMMVQYKNMGAQLHYSQYSLCFQIKLRVHPIHPGRRRR